MAILASQHVIVPLRLDKSSLDGMKSLGKTLAGWREGWKKRQEIARQLNVPVPDAASVGKPLGYIPLLSNTHNGCVTKGYLPYWHRIPETYRSSFEVDSPMKGDVDPCCLGTIRPYSTIIPFAERRNIPVFKLPRSFGVQVLSAAEDYDMLTRRLSLNLGLGR